MPSRTTAEVLAHLAALKDHTRRLLALDDQDTVLISELRCAEPGCPPLETVVAVLSADHAPRRWTIHLPLDQVDPDEIGAALSRPFAEH